MYNYNIYHTPMFAINIKLIFIKKVLSKDFFNLL